MELEQLPRRVLFIGGGYISFEFTHMAVRAGADVTVLTRGDRPLKGFDPDLVDRLVERSRAAGIRLRTNADIKGIEQSEEGMRVHRSEEHTSELQSLMRISYAVFCL